MHNVQQNTKCSHYLTKIVTFYVSLVQAFLDERITNALDSENSSQPNVKEQAISVQMALLCYFSVKGFHKAPQDLKKKKDNPL